MRFKVTLKSSDACQDVINRKMQYFAARLAEEDLSHDGVDGILDERAHEMQAEIERWFKEGEYLTVELDTEAHTCTVVKP